MNTIIYRIGLTGIAVALGVTLVYGLTILGNASTGPVEDVVTGLSSGVSTLERKFILEERKESRSKLLAWFNPYREQLVRLKETTKILLGAYDNTSNESYESVVDLEKDLHTVFPLIHLYVAWGSKPEQQFPYSTLRAISDLGSTPVITWEPWLTSFDNEKYPNLPPADKRDHAGMQAVAKGDYDFYISKWAEGVKKFNLPIFIRLGHEMNDPYRYPWGPQNNTAAEFIAAWKHAVDLFRKQGVNNVIWVWAPHPAYWNTADWYYPGDEYVDWVGTGTLNYGTVATWSQWWSFDDIFGKFYSQVSKHNKPIMITELGSLSVGGSRAEWYKTALGNLPIRYPLVKSVVFYHSSSDNTTTNKTLNWQIKDDAKTIAAIKEAVGTW